MGLTKMLWKKEGSSIGWIGIIFFFLQMIAVQPILAEESVELLKNPGFEEGTFKIPGSNIDMAEGWFMNRSFWGYAEVVRDPKVAHSGNQCLMLQYRHDPERKKGYCRVIIESDPITVEKGKEYLIRIWVKGGEIGKEFGIRFYEYKDSLEEGRKIVKFLCGVNATPLSPLILSDNWKLYEGIYEPESPEVETARLTFATEENSLESIWVDDASVKIRELY